MKKPIITFMLCLLSVLLTNQVSAAPTERGFTIQYLEPTESVCADSTTLKPQHNTADLCVQGLGSESRQEVCDHTKNQAWEMMPAGAGLFQLRSIMTNKCLKMASGARNAAIIETTCGTGDQLQVFKIGPSPSPIEANQGAGGMCLDVAGNLTAAGTKMQAWDCHGGDNQLFAYDEQATQCELDDLKGTKIYMDVIKDGVGGTVDTIDATAKTGGGLISKKYCVPILDDTTATHINIEVTAFDESGNESVKTPTLVHQVAGTRDCTLITSPNCTEAVRIVDAQQREWLIGPNNELLMDGTDTTGRGTMYLLAIGEVYTLGMASEWWHWDDPNSQWVNVGATKPLCTVPDTTPPAIPQGLKITQFTIGGG